MRAPEPIARADTIARLARSRAELRELLEPDRPEGPPAGQPGDGAGHSRHPGGFPRSRTMRLLTSRHGAGTAAVLGAGFLLSRPAMALRLLKMIPLGAAARLLMSKRV